MTSEPRFPDLVQAMIASHYASAQLRIARIGDELNRMPVVTARSAVLRRERDQLTEQMKAWSYLADVTRDGLHAGAAMEHPSDDSG